MRSMAAVSVSTVTGILMMIVPSLCLRGLARLRLGDNLVNLFDEFHRSTI